MDAPDILSVIEPVIQTFEQLGVSYYIGGSVASSALGLFRATLDVDLVANLKERHVRVLVSMLEKAYYIDEEMILDAIRRQASCNLLHLERCTKSIFLS